MGSTKLVSHDSWSRDRQMSLALHPSPQLLQAAKFWLSQSALENPNAEIALNKFVPDAGWNVAILQQSERIAAISIVTPQKMGFLEGNEPDAVRELFERVYCPGRVRKLTLSGRAKAWLRPTLVQRTRIVREHDLLAMTCSTAPSNIEGRWATIADIPVLQQYQAAYNLERRTALAPDWEELLSRPNVAVLERSGRVAAAVKRCATTARYACIGGTFTFHSYRQQGLASRLTGFIVTETLKERPVVYLMVDDDNAGAIALYHRVGFEEIGGCYMAYLE